MFECVARCLEPCAPWLCGCMTGCDGRVVWRGEAQRRRRLVALTIDDVPNEGTMTVDGLLALLALLDVHNARATFFVIWNAAKRVDSSVLFTMLKTIHGKNHEIGVHFDGRWGCTVSDAAICRETTEMLHALQNFCGVKPKYARLPGGFSRQSTVTLLNDTFDLTVVNGTAYPFDVDLCKWRSAKRLGQCAANLGRDGGRIAILHDREDLHEKVKAFLDQAASNRCHVVRLDTLLDDIHPEARSRLILPVLAL